MVFNTENGHLHRPGDVPAEKKVVICVFQFSVKPEVLKTTEIVSNASEMPRGRSITTRGNEAFPIHNRVFQSTNHI